MKFRIEKIETIDEYQFRLHLDGPDFFNALHGIVDGLRAKSKYLDETGSWDEAYVWVIDELDSRGIDIFSY